MRTTERDIKKYFKKKVGCKVNEVILLRDKRTGSHKGCAYLQFARIEDVGRAVGVSGQAPDFQRFPILVKGSEAEKNHSVPASSSVVTSSMMGTAPSKALLLDASGKQIESQKVYVGGLDPSVTDEHLFAIFSQFGQLEKVSMQMDPVTNASRGYAFLSFHDPKDAHLAIQTMANQVLAGRPLKTGWANQASSIPGVSVVTSDEFPPDGNERAQKAFAVVGRLMGVSSEASVNATALSTTAEKAIDAAMGMGEATVDESAAPSGDKSSGTESASAISTVADARADMAESIAAQESAVAAAAVIAALNPTVTATNLISGAENPTCHLLVHNMYDKNEETEQGWEKDIKEEFIEEVSKFGKVIQATVMHQEPGGKIYVSFETVDGAKACADNLAGRWFDKRQLRVDFVNENELPTSSSNEDSAAT
jgi:RNA-binding protein 39